MAQSNIKARGTTRRRFLQGASLAGIGFWAAGRRDEAFADSPNERINIACIGVGGKGSSDTDQAGNYGNIVAICDIDDQRLAAKAEKFPQAKTYNDYRKLLDEMHAQIDAVVVSTPDHTHAPAAVRAMRLGKHVYCQKPLTHSVAEARLMRDTAREYKVATQMGNQGTAASGFRRGVEIIRSGAIGPVREVHVWTNRPFKYWKQAPDIVARPKDTPPTPPYVHWDLFLGTAPERPYHPVYHPHNWRGWWDFGTGSLGDMACHTTNLPFMALKLGYPTRVSATSGEINPETYPAWATITYEFPARGELPPVKLTWYEGARDGQRNLPRPELLLGETASSSGALLIGEKGAMFSPNDYGAEQKLLPAKQFEGYQPPEPTLARMEEGRGIDDNQKGEWIRAIRGGPPAMSNFDYAAVLTETMLLGNVAVRLGKALDYDAEQMRVVNCPDAAAWISPKYRKGWEI
ncbi:MAG TPA: Gfo/Idh/MocA family oxidoreductase [Pirellulales bacterium]|nr:Gfo/Idh/MocA family oxidoreductase [Pirellulales bacterium]